MKNGLSIHDCNTIRRNDLFTRLDILCTLRIYLDNVAMQQKHFHKNVKPKKSTIFL